MADHDEAFDKIMEIVGNDGPFQWRFNCIYNVAMTAIVGMTCMNIVLALNAPEHWCDVPGRDQTNYTVDQWKHLTIPREVDVKGISSFSKCKMYNVSYEEIQLWDYENWNSTEQHEKLGVVECDKHVFDKQWYESTIVSQEDWVCSKDLYQTNSFFLHRVGESLGTFVFGQLGDRLGRKIIFYVSALAILIGRILIMLTTSHDTWYFVSSVIGSLSGISIFLSPFIIGMEIAKPDDRSNVAVMQNFSWTAGMCVMPILYYFARDWMTFFILTTAPFAIFLFIPKYMIESPRWLVNRGKYDKAAMYLNRIAKINNKSIKQPITGKLIQSMLPKNSEPEKLYGMLSLFSGLRLAKNTIILMLCWMACTLSYFTLILYVAQTAGNPFWNFFMQSIVDAPAFFLATWMTDNLGRRWTNSLSFLLAGLFCIPTVLLLTHPEYEHLATYSTFLVKFWTAITFFAINLQSMETYPTCLRQTGLAIGTIASNVIGTLGPYLAYLGTKYDSRYPIVILGMLFVFGSFCGLFLPETLHQKLPDSLEEAKKFGANQKFWSLPRPAKDSEDSKMEQTEEKERLNPPL